MAPILFYEYISPYNIRFDPLDIVEIIFWFITMGIMAYIGYLFVRDRRNVKNFKYIGYFFLSFVVARIFRLISKFIIGYEYGDYQFEGALFTCQIIYTLVSYFSFFFIYYYGEKEILTSSHHFFTTLVIVVTILSILNYIFTVIMVVLTPLFILMLIALPGVLIIHGSRVDGILRRKSFIVAFSTLAIIFGIAFDVPEAAVIWMNVPGLTTVSKILSPVLQILGTIGVRYGLTIEINE